MKQVRKFFSFCTSTLLKAVSHYSTHQSLIDHGYSITPMEQAKVQPANNTQGAPSGGLKQPVNGEEEK
ncbi:MULTISPECIES: hypothetical protein [Vibrio]|uniref:hypothetical protein n=1 Tax=Vibrio TaxID=662 RepID=UPI000BFFCEF5|nr:MULTISPECIES: hypothetical protein [unclassified Vibrio]PHJ43400.1 hypothetical protein AK965_00125 [Vibrio sp. PID17_43]RIZ55220.1 hypothetical protein AK966_07785 [Vibrio sp. PID23_8]